MARSLEYAVRGLVGVLTPQANTTVEPELAILWPAGVASIAARMTSAADTIEARLQDYTAGLDQWLGRFGNAPIDAYVFATTGASYLMGPAGEDAMVSRVNEGRAAPLVTTACAVCDALGALNARSIGIVSPYPQALTDASVRYWEARGFRVDAVAQATEATTAFHPIYAMAGRRASSALETMGGRAMDAIVLLGTGMPTLAALAAAAPRDGPPVLSCNVALAWRTVLSLDDMAPSQDNLRPWINGREWAERYRARNST